MSSPTSDKLAQGLSKIGLVMRHQAWKAGCDSGLTPTQAQVLGLLHARGGTSGMTVSSVAAELAVTTATTSDSIAALERKGLVVRRRDERDGRVVRVMLTPEGVTTARHSAVWPDMLLTAIDTLNAEEQRAFVRGLVKMIHSLQQQGQIPIARMCPTCTHFRPHAHPSQPQPHHCAYVDAPLSDSDLRLECAEHEAAPDAERARAWQLFVNGAPPAQRARADGAATESSGPVDVPKGE